MAFVTATGILPQTRFAGTVGAQDLNWSRRCRRFRAKYESPQASLGQHILAGVCVLGTTGTHDVKPFTLARTIDAPRVGSLHVGGTNSLLSNVPQQKIDVPVSPSTESNEETTGEGGLDANTLEQSKDPATLQLPTIAPQPLSKTLTGEHNPSDVDKPCRSRRGAFLLGAGALATVLVVRRRSCRSRPTREPYSDDENLKAVTLARPVEIIPEVSGEGPSPVPNSSPTTGTEKSMDEDLQNIFSHSRAEWDEPGYTSDQPDETRIPNDKQSVGHGKDSIDSGGNVDTNAPQASTYSYSFRTSHKPRPRTSQTVGEERNKNRVQNVMPNNLDGSTSAAGSTFRHMRVEFTADGKQVVEEEVMKQAGEPKSHENWPAVSSDSTDHFTDPSSIRNSEPVMDTGALRGPMTGGELLRRVIGTPLWAMREILIPTWEILSVGWTDTRSRLVDVLEGRNGLFLLGSDMDETVYGSQYDQNRSAGTEFASSKGGNAYQEGFYDEEKLSEEERQILWFERATSQAASQVQTSVKRFLRFFW